MKNVLSKLIFCLLFSTITLADINVAKEQCEDLGFKPGTEKYADCVMKLLPKEKSKKQQPNADKVIKEIDQNIKKIGEDITKSLKIEIAVKGKKLKNFFTNNDLILISENGSREYKFKEKNYEIIKDDTVIQKGSWKIHGLLQNQIRLISKDDKKKYYLKKISKKPWIYNYDKLPSSKEATKEILHIKSSSKFSDISSNVEFSSTNSAELTESKLEETKIAKKEITKEINIKENKIEVIKKENKVDKIEVTKKVEPKIEKDDGIDLLSSTKNKKKKKQKQNASNNKNKADLLLRVNCWSKKDGYPDSERAKLYGKELYFIIDTKQNTVERFYQEGQDEIKQTLYNIVEINEKKVIYQAQIFNPNKNRKIEFEYEFYYGGTTDHNGFGYPINRLKPDVRKPYIACSKEYHSIEGFKKENKVDKIEVTKKVEPKIEKDDGIDLLSSTKNKNKKKKKQKQNASNNKNKDNEFQFSLYRGLDYKNLSNIDAVISAKGSLALFLDLNYSRGYGFYKGESINGIPNGKGKWSNCYQERYIKIVNELDLVGSLTKKYHANEINVDDFINEILDNDVRFIMSPEYISSNKMAYGLYFDLTNGDKGEPKISTFEPCEVIVGTWKNGSLNGYAKIFTLGEPNTIPNLENLWSDIDINTNYLDDPFGKHAKIWIRKFENDIAIEDLSAIISVNQGQGILSSLDENGYPDGLGFIYLANGSNLMVNFKNGEIDYDQNIIGFFNNEKSKPNYKSQDIGNILEKNIDFFKEFKSELYLTLAKNNFKDKDRPSFLKQSSFLKKRDSFKNNLYKFNNKLFWIDTSGKSYGRKPNFPGISEDIKPYTYYRGKMINDKGKLIYNGKGILIRYTGQEIRYNEGEFKNNVFVEGYQLLDKGSQYQIRANKNVNFQSERQKILNHTSELYLGSLNEFGPNGKGTMIMPYGMVYVGEWKDNNFHGKGEIRKYENKKITIKEKGSAAKKTIPNLRYSLKGNFSKGTFEGDMEGYIYEAKFDAADVITDIVKKDISGLYSKGKLVKSSVVKKVEAKKLDRPVFKPEGDPTQAIIQAENLAAKIGCIGHQMDGVFGKFLIYPCATYDDYEEAMKNNGASKLEEFKKEKVLKTNSSMFRNISNDTNESFYVEDVKVTKFQNPNKISQQDFVISKCRIQKLSNLKKNEIYFNETVYIIDINNLSIKRIRKNKKDDSLEEKIFPITTIISPFDTFHVQYFDDEKMNFVPEYKSAEIREFINKSKNSKKIEFRSIKEIRIAFDMTSNDMEQYTLALSDESIFLDILKSGSINVETRFGFTPYAFGRGKDKTAVIDPLDKGSQIIESCAKLETDKKIEIAKKDIAKKNIKGTIENYHQSIKDSGLISLVDFGLEGEEEPYFRGYQKNISGTVNG